MRALALALAAAALAGCSAAGPAPAAAPKAAKSEVLACEDWLVRQSARSAALLEELAGGYTPQAPLVVPDPYGAAPLTALVLFDTQKPCTVEIAIPGDTESASFRHAFGQEGTRHQIPVYGLYPGRVNPVQLTLAYQDGSVETVTVPIATDPLPDYLVPYEATVTQHESADGELLYMAMATDTVYPFAVDANGDVRWYASDNAFSGGIFRRLENGRYLGFSSPLYAPAFLRPGVVELDRMGRVYREYLHDLIHHDAIELPGGNLLALTVKSDSQLTTGGMTVGLDRIVELDRATGAEVRGWDLNELCGYTAGDVAEGRYLHCNALWYSEADDAILVSAASACCVIKLDAATGEVVWALADPRRGYPEPIQSKILTPAGEGFEWQALQHAVMLAGNGDVLMLDNGTGRLGENGEPVPDLENYSRLLRLRVNEGQGTVEQIYQYGKERGHELFAAYLGDVDELGPGHYLLTAGGRILNEDGTASGTVLDAYMGIKATEAKIVEIRDGQVVFEVHVGGGGRFANIYRAEWASVYAPGEGEYDLQAAGKRSGTLLPSARVEFRLPENPLKLENFSAQPTDQGYQLSVPVQAELGQGDTLLLELRRGDTTLYYSAAGATGAQALVRAAGLEAGEYELALALARADGRVYYAPLGCRWNCGG